MADAIKHSSYTTRQMNGRLETQIERLTGDISIAAIGSWLKMHGLPHSAPSREVINARLVRLIKKGRLSLDELIEGAIDLEEASSKRVILYDLPVDGGRARFERRVLQQRATRLNAAVSGAICISPDPPAQPTLVYLAFSADWVRAKYVEAQQDIEPDLAHQRLRLVTVKKLVVAIADRQTGILQVRLDAPAEVHSHTNREGRPSGSLYRDFYVGEVSRLYGCRLEPIDLRPILRALSEAEPRLLELSLGKVRTGYNSRMRVSNPIDIRDDPTWQAAYRQGGAEMAYEQCAGKWFAGASRGQLTRDIFTDIKATDGTLRFLADCLDSEIEYAISKISEFRGRVAAA